MIESDVGIDVRKTLFYTLAEKGWPLVGLESLGMNLEDIFISIVDTTDKPVRRDNRRRVVRNTKDALEKEYASEMIKKAQSPSVDN